MSNDVNCKCNTVNILTIDYKGENNLTTTENEIDDDVDDEIENFEL